MTKQGQKRLKKLIHLIKTETVNWQWKFNTVCYANCGCAMRYFPLLDSRTWTIDTYINNGLYFREPRVHIEGCAHGVHITLIAEYFGCTEEEVQQLFYAPNNFNYDITKEQWIARAEAYLESQS